MYNKKNGKTLFLLLVFTINFLLTPAFVLSQSENECSDADCWENLINQTERQLEETRQKKNTLQSQINYMNQQIDLAKLRIKETEYKIKDLNEQIENLSQKIGRLEGSLDSISEILIERIISVYKAREVTPAYLLFTSQGFSQFFNRVKYLKAAQSHDKKLLYAIQSSKNSYQKQKDLRKEKKTELEKLQTKLEDQQTILAQQKTQKANLLQITKQSEKRYQALLAEAKAELAAIQEAVKVLQVSGEPVKVSRGELIGVQGSTGYSTGAHLHFGVYNYSSIEDLKSDWYYSNYENPLGILSGRDISWNTGCETASNKKIGSGGWQWPMKSIKYISQGFGVTCHSNWLYGGKPHPALDIVGPSGASIYAVEEGTAYFCRNCLGDGGNGVFVFHPNGKMTMYWHVR